MSIRKKVRITFATACAIIAAFSGAMVWVQLIAIDRGAQTEARNAARSVAYSAATEPSGLQLLINRLEAVYKRDVVVTDRNKVTIADVNPSEVGETYADDPDNEVNKTLDDGKTRVFREKARPGAPDSMQVVVPVREMGDASRPVIGAVILEYSRVHEELLAASMWQIYAAIGGGICAMIFVGVFGVRLGDSLSRRVTDLRRAVERIAEGELSVRLPIDSLGEIKGLQRAFNKMAEELQSSRAKLVGEVERERETGLRIERLAYSDPVTGLPNRALFAKDLAARLEECRSASKGFAVMFIDLDQFKVINDTLGHQAGDTLLQTVSERLKVHASNGSLLARIGGDEFVMLVSGDNDREGLASLATECLTSISQPFNQDGQEFRVTASIGLSLFPADGIDEATLMRRADVAMYHAKEEGRNTFAFYAQDMDRHSVEMLAFESSLRRALDRGEFEVHYQPKVSCRTGQMTGVEALVRWNHPDLGLVSPAKFIPVAEETGLIVPLGLWVLRRACEQQVQWIEDGVGNFKVAVNLSARQFSHPDLLKDVLGIVASTGISPRSLELELTESMLMRNVSKAVATIHAFRRHAIGVSVDDFGTGYSSLANLKRFPIDTLKIDRSFIRDLGSKKEDRAMAAAIISMGKSLGLTIVAEGVESQVQAAFLMDEGCDEIQGFFYSRARPPLGIEDLISRNADGPLSGKSIERTTADTSFLATVI